MKRRRKKNDRIADDRETYRWWFEFLKLNDEYRRCCRARGAGSDLARLYADFGDIFNTTFEKWYEERAEILFKPQRFVFDHVENSEAFRAYLSDKNHAVVVAVNLDAPRELLIEEFPRFINQFKPAQIGRRGRGFSGAWYPLRDGPKPATLETIYNVLMECAKADKEHREQGGKKRELWQIAHQMFAHPRDRSRAPTLDEQHNYEVRMRKYLDQAEALKRNAALNLFPVDRMVNPDDYVTLQKMEEIYVRMRGG
jgi:hypothetical protein